MSRVQRPGHRWGIWWMGVGLWALWSGCALPMMTPPPPLTMRAGWVGGGTLHSAVYALEVESHVRTLDGATYVRYTRGNEQWQAAPGMVGLLLPLAPTRRYVVEMWGMPLSLQGVDGDLAGREENTRVGAVLVGVWRRSPVFPERIRLYVSGGIWLGSSSWRLMQGMYGAGAIEILAVVRDAQGMFQVSGSLYPPGAALQVRLPGTPVEVYALAATPWIHPLFSTEYLRWMLHWMFGPLAGGQEVYRYPLYPIVGGGVRLGF